MPKPHDKKLHHRGVGAQLVTPATDLMNRFTNNATQQAWATDQVTNEGPEHKQVLNAVLLQQLYSLVTAIEASTGQMLQLQPGETITSHKEERVIPISFPMGNITAANKQTVLETIAKAPEHELVVYALLQQVATWGTKVLVGNQ